MELVTVFYSFFINAYCAIIIPSVGNLCSAKGSFKLSSKHLWRDSTTANNWENNLPRASSRWRLQSLIKAILGPPIFLDLDYDHPAKSAVVSKIIVFS
jgi:hypothetical protein